MMAREALFCRDTLWRDTIRVSTNVVAEEFLANGWRCTWLTSPVTLTRWWQMDARHRRRLSLWQHDGEQHGALLEYAPATPLAWSWRPVLRSPWLGRNGLRLAWPSIASVLTRHEFSNRPRLLWIGSLSMASALRAIDAERTAYHAHDLFMEYPGAPVQLRKLERWLIEHVDAIFATSTRTQEALVERYGIANEKVHMLGHGVHLDRYVATPEPAELESLGRPRAVALGTLQELDAELLVRLAAHRPDTQFVCIGPGGEHIAAASAARGLRNIHLLGPRPHEVVPTYLMHADVGLILYPFADAARRRTGCTPMKLLEYAAAGLPVVSTWLPEYARSGAPVLSARDADELEAHFDAALIPDRNLQARMRAFARSHTWRAKYDFICERLGL
jgi:glycosyltransferase involved in cell wall biosynthesis